MCEDERRRVCGTLMGRILFMVPGPHGKLIRRHEKNLAALASVRIDSRIGRGLALFRGFHNVAELDDPLKLIAAFSYSGKWKRQSHGSMHGRWRPLTCATGAFNDWDKPMMAMLGMLRVKFGMSSQGMSLSKGQMSCGATAMPRSLDLHGNCTPYLNHPSHAHNAWFMIVARELYISERRCVVVKSDQATAAINI